MSRPSVTVRAIGEGILRSLLWLLCSVSVCAAAQPLATLSKAALKGEFLLQTNYEQKNGLQDFMTSRSRIVSFHRHKGSLWMMLDPHDPLRQARKLGAVPIRAETARTVTVDFNAGLDEIDEAEDRTGEDYYGRVDKPDTEFFRLFHRHMLSVSRDGSLLILNQRALNKYHRPVFVHYYLCPYHPDSDFKPFVMKSLHHFGFYETYPRRVKGHTVMYAMKFDAHRPIVFALSAQIPERYRQAVRDGVLYWNKAFGRHLVHVVDAPEGVTAPNPEYNVIQWVTSGHYASTAHIQSDPLTGEILHADIFILSSTVDQGDLSERRDELRYVVAHEVGHALGLRHNFAPGPPSTVMNYFGLKELVRIGRDVIASGHKALPYDREVIRHVYLGAPLDLKTMPGFCTDAQPGCEPQTNTVPGS